MSGYTPGPWRKDHTHPDPETAKKLAYINARGRRDPLEIACVYYGCEKDEQDANARLIAAAPDLLEALEEMLEDYADAALEWDTENKWTALKITRKAEAAIAKAKGET